jgi:CHASE2 domain-containing sensor protein
MISWQIAITITFFAFAVDLLENRPTYGTAGWICVIAATIVVSGLTSRWQSAKPLFILLTLTATGFGMLKSYLPPVKGAPSPLTQAIFVGTAVACVWMASRIGSRDPGADGA